MKMRDRSLNVKGDNIRPNKVIIEKSFYVKQMSKNQSQLVIDHKNDGFLLVYFSLFKHRHIFSHIKEHEVFRCIHTNK